MTDNKNVKVDIIEILNNADGMEHVAIHCANDKGENETMIKVTDIINLLNSQKAKIEGLVEERENIKTTFDKLLVEVREAKELYLKDIAEAKTKAIKEYKEKVKQVLMGKSIFPVLIKNALEEAEKELVGENDV